MSSSRSSVFLPVANAAAYLATVAVNSLANVAALGGRTTGEVSDAYPTLVAPAGYVFSIWGVIYVLLLAFVIFQALPRNRDKPFLHRIGGLFVLSCVANVVWLFLWHYLQIVLSTVLMFVLLGSLIAIYLRLEIGKSGVALREKLLVHLPFSVYLGWITVASIANVAAALTAIGWDGLGLGNVIWTVLVIIVALIITLAVTVTRRDIGYGLVIIWALIGIAVKQIGEQSIVMTAGAGVIIIAIALIFAGTGLITKALKRPG